MVATAEPKTKTNKKDEALEKVERGVKQLLNSDNWAQWLKLQAQFHDYSFSNVLLILQQYPTATQVAGYRAWQKLGRQVREGERGIKILAPIKKKIVEEDEYGEQHTSYPIVGYKTVTVFALEQTEGEPLPEVCSPLQGDDRGLIESLSRFSQFNGVPVAFRDTGDAHGRCRFDRERNPVEIAVSDADEPLQQAKTLAHEIAHSILHSAEEYASHTTTSVKEVEAESTAYVVLDAFRLDTSGYSFGYIASWGEGDEAIKAVRSSGQRIQSAANRIIDFVESESSG